MRAMHRLLPFFVPMIFTHQGFCWTQLRLQCAWQSNVLGSGWKHCYRHKHMETKARWVVKCLTASTTPTPSRLCELEMAPLTRMLQNDSDFSREQTRSDVSFCGFLGILIQLRVGFSKNPGLEKLHYDKQICRSLAVDHGVWCLKALGESWRAWGIIWGAIEWICCNYAYIYISIHTPLYRYICVYIILCEEVVMACPICGFSNGIQTEPTCSLISKNEASLCWNSTQVAPSFPTNKKAHGELIFSHVCYKLEGWSTACSDIKKCIWLSNARVLFCLFLLIIHIYTVYMIPVRGSLPPPPPSPPMVWSQNLHFAAFCMKTWYVQCFLHGGWLARTASLQIRRDFLQPTSENVFFAMFRLRHRGVVPLHPPLCRITYI